MAGTQRIRGIDVARAIAILGMVLVNVRSKTHAYATDIDALAWALDRSEGKFAALFVLLAGIGIALRSPRRTLADREQTHAARRALLERAGILLVVGLLNALLWSWDILHCYAAYLALAAVFLRASDRALLGLAAAVMATSVVLQLSFDRFIDVDFWSVSGFAWHVGFGGLYPVFPWLSFLLVGMWLGHQDLRDPAWRRRLLAIAVAVLAVAELADWAARPDGLAWLTGEHAHLLRSWPRPARPGFVVGGTAFAIACVCLSIEAADRWATSRVTEAVIATGQLAFTLYVAHAVAIVVPVRLGILTGLTVEQAVLYGLAVYALAGAASVWWRHRWPFGPLEALIRKVTHR
jgi:uncharacterized membrane protein YeiB